MRSATVIAAAFGSAILGCAAQAAPPKLPATVTADLETVAAECTGVGGKALTDDAVRQVDLNGDGSGGAQSPFTAAAYDVQVEGTGPAARLWLTVSGGQCGQKQAATFAEEKFCERPLAWNPAARRFDFAPVSAVRMLQ